MKLVCRGKFNGDPESLPHGAHRPGAVKFKEFDSPKQMAVFANVLSFVILAALLAGYLLRFFTAGLTLRELVSAPAFPLGCVLPLLALFPHELLHAACFRDEVYLYTNWKQGMLFVVGPETMTRRRFVFMSLLPNLVFGLLPYVAAMIRPELVFLGIFGALSAGMGAGDYYNVFNALTQMPRGARTYLYQFNSYWYLPEDPGGT